MAVVQIQLVNMARLLKRLEPVPQALRHLERIGDQRPSVSEGSVSAHCPLDMFGRPSFIQRVQPCKMLVLRQSYLPMLSCEVGNIPFPPQVDGALCGFSMTDNPCSLHMRSDTSRSFRCSVLE